MAHMTFPHATALVGGQYYCHYSLCYIDLRVRVRFHTDCCERPAFPTQQNDLSEAVEPRTQAAVGWPNPHYLSSEEANRVVSSKNGSRNISEQHVHVPRVQKSLELVDVERHVVVPVVRMDSLRHNSFQHVPGDLLHVCPMCASDSLAHL
eukprot:9482560-Pyramimonas_sp.AAC.1